MVICAKCTEEMKCTKSSRPVVYRGNHVYNGEEYSCRKCGSVIVVANSQGYHLERALAVLEEDKPIDMRK